MSIEKSNCFVLICQLFKKYILFSIPMNKENFLPLNKYTVKMMTNSNAENSLSKTQQFEILFAKSNKGESLIIHENKVIMFVVDIFQFKLMMVHCTETIDKKRKLFKRDLILYRIDFLKKKSTQMNFYLVCHC